MFHFLHGWHRKIGCVALALACALMVAYLRGHIIGDAYYFGNGEGSSFLSVSSSYSGLSWRRVKSNGGIMWMPGWVTYPIQNEASIDLDNINPEFVLISISENFYGRGPSKSVEATTIPYWCLIPPLTLLSAYLILWKPPKQESLPPSCPN
ncbi:MAG TPA: hypothetical protein VGM98_18220 [Schlesneria sp.]|jgi:hypothetical protein